MSALLSKTRSFALELSLKNEVNFIKISPEAFRARRFTTSGEMRNEKQKNSRTKRGSNRKYRTLKNMESLKQIMALSGSNSSSGDSNSSNRRKEEEQRKKETMMKFDEQREMLLAEARAITKSHYRRCLRCVDILRPGNDHDEAQFKEREEEEKRHLDETLSTADLNEGFSVSLPVDRKNELASRANYYEEWIKENFHGEKDCLDSKPWHEENVNRYVELIRRGEKKRKWILDDYKFDDIYTNQFDHRRVDEFETQALTLVKDVYNHNGWVLRSNLTDEDFSSLDESDDLLWDDDH